TGFYGPGLLSGSRTPRLSRTLPTYGITSITDRRSISRFTWDTTWRLRSTSVWKHRMTARWFMRLLWEFMATALSSTTAMDYRRSMATSAGLMSMKATRERKTNYWGERPR